MVTSGSSPAFAGRTRTRRRFDLEVGAHVICRGGEHRVRDRGAGADRRLPSDGIRTAAARRAGRARSGWRSPNASSRMRTGTVLCVLGASSANEARYRSCDTVTTHHGAAPNLSRSSTASRHASNGAPTGMTSGVVASNRRVRPRPRGRCSRSYTIRPLGGTGCPRTRSAISLPPIAPEAIAVAPDCGRLPVGCSPSPRIHVANCASAKSSPHNFRRTRTLGSAARLRRGERGAQCIVVAMSRAARRGSSL